MIVVDSSAIVHALVATAVNPGLLAVLSDEELCAPHLLDFEVASALRGHVLGRKLAPERGEEALADYSQMQILRYEGIGLFSQIWRCRDNFTVYDAAYVALAIGLKTPLVTSDAKLREAERLDVEVRLFPQAP
ncbi:MAG: type II toxin-antitoxin system VapC family toxin [Micromonosporaceae bacterium]